MLKDREGRAATGQPVIPRLNRIVYEDAAADPRTHDQRTKRIAAIGPADVTRYVAARQAEGAANGSINRELAVLGRMLKLAYENGKHIRLPLIHKLKERHRRPDLQAAVSIAYAFGWSPARPRSP